MVNHVPYTNMILMMSWVLLHLLLIYCSGVVVNFEVQEFITTPSQCFSHRTMYSIEHTH